jgi:hypothetical protein
MLRLKGIIFERFSKYRKVTSIYTKNYFIFYEYQNIHRILGCIYLYTWHVKCDYYYDILVYTNPGAEQVKPALVDYISRPIYPYTINLKSEII